LANREFFVCVVSILGEWNAEGLQKKSRLGIKRRLKENQRKLFSVDLEEIGGKTLESFEFSSSANFFLLTLESTRKSRPSIVSPLFVLCSSISSSSLETKSESLAEIENVYKDTKKIIRNWV
jgi:hypothetical protein